MRNIARKILFVLFYPFRMLGRFFDWLNGHNQATVFFGITLFYGAVVSFNIWVASHNSNYACAVLNTILFGYVMYCDYWRRRYEEISENREIELKRTQLFIQMFNGFMNRYERPRQSSSNEPLN